MTRTSRESRLGLENFVLVKSSEGIFLEFKMCKLDVCDDISVVITK